MQVSLTTESARRRAARLCLMAIVLACAAPAGAALPALDDLQPVPLHDGVNRLPGFTLDGHAATVFMAHRENGNAHGYDVLMLSIDDFHAAAELVEIEPQAGESPDMMRIEPFDGENAISAIRFARGRLGGVPAMLMLQARRRVDQVQALTDAAPVELRVWRLDGPSDDIGRTPYLFRLAGVTTTTQRYRDAGAALDRELGISVPTSPYTHLPPAEGVAADIAASGAHAVLQERLWPDQRVFEALLSQVETGDPRWLRIAVALRTVSDAGASEGLSGALSVALAAQTDNVLRSLATVDRASPFTVAEVCSARFAFIEQPDAEKRWRGEVSDALTHARDMRLAASRSACLAALPPAQ